MGKKKTKIVAILPQKILHNLFLLPKIIKVMSLIYKYHMTMGDIRSGSCPSQLLQIKPTQENNTTTSSSNHHRFYSGTVQGTLPTSQRVKHKERPSLPISFIQRLVKTAPKFIVTFGLELILKNNYKCIVLFFFFLIFRNVSFVFLHV